MPERWWEAAVFYQVYPRSFADGNGDGDGDLIGLRERLDYIKRLGVDALWISPFYLSPMADGGYDVADPCDVDPRFGTLADFDAMLAAAHERGLKLTIDIVPNHFSEAHPWFQAALAAPRGSAERNRFIFRDGRGPDGAEPPNNWVSIFGGPAWHRVPSTGPDDPGQWYLHIFAPEQPDLNWTNPEVAEEFDRILRFWLDRGVDGFRVDVGHGMDKPEDLPDMPEELLNPKDLGGAMFHGYDPRFDQDGVHAIHRRFRRVLDEYDDRMAVVEAWVPDPERLARYVRPDQLHLAFNFHLVEAKWGAANYRAAIEDSLPALRSVGAPATWVLANHDVDRTVSRYGGGALGVARARAAALVLFSLPGAIYIYNGDELGLANVDLPDEALQDPTWERSGHTERGRDGERVPMPWSGAAPPYGFGTNPATWLPMPDNWGPATVEAQDADPSSMLGLYRRGLALRTTVAGLTRGEFAWIDSAADVLAYRRGDVSILLNTGTSVVPVPDGEVLLSSVPLPPDGTLPPDTAVWVRTAR